MVMLLYNVAKVAECIPRDVSRSDIKSTFRAVNPLGGISMANWSMIAPVIVSSCMKDIIYQEIEAHDCHVTTRCGKMGQFIFKFSVDRKSRREKLHVLFSKGGVKWVLTEQFHWQTLDGRLARRILAFDFAG